MVVSKLFMGEVQGSSTMSTMGSRIDICTIFHQQVNDIQMTTKCSFMYGLPPMFISLAY
jgi:hypothetical protein